MDDFVLRVNAIPVYAFLSQIVNTAGSIEELKNKKILDCGAGGPRPPLAIFHRFGFETHGIDLSNEQIKKADDFCRKEGINLNIIRGDVRSIPYDDMAFDFVYEQFAICHLTKKDTATAIKEMHRVLKPGGLCLLGLISAETWPVTGEEKEPGEFWTEEDEFGLVVHSFFDDHEADRYIKGFDIIKKEKVIQWAWESLTKMTLTGWMELYDKAPRKIGRDDWGKLYDERFSRARYVHIYYLLKKPH
jgi:ubiquinone/menaquinone biosynthesis C-methylase UbiE